MDQRAALRSSLAASKQSPGFVGAKRLDLLATKAVGVDEGADVPAHPRTLYGELQGRDRIRWACSTQAEERP